MGLIQDDIVVLQKHPPKVFYNKRCSQKGVLFSCEFFKISKNTFFTEQLRTTAPGPTVWNRILVESMNIGSLEFLQ